jgi:predicted ATPase
MISQVSLRNVRLFGDEPRAFRLKPLTVFCGSNSSGKSTILKIFPLLRQSQGIRESAEEESGKLRFKGTQVDLGSYSTLVCDNDISRHMHFGMRVAHQASENIVDFIQFLKENKASDFKTNKADTQFTEVELDYSFEFLAESIDDKNPSSGKGLAKISGGLLLKASFAILHNNNVIFDCSVERMNAGEDKQVQVPNTFGDEALPRLYKIFIPTYFFEHIGLSEGILPQQTEKPEYTTLISILRGLLPTTLVADPKPDPVHASAPGSPHNFQRWPIPVLMEWQSELFKTALLNVHYVAPLRSPGKRYYVADLETVPSMDPTGEFLPYILRDKGEDIVVNALPSELGNPKEESLTSALSDWLGYLRTGSFEGSEARQKEFELEISDILVGLKLKSSGTAKKASTNHSLADSGFGYSQIVPILVRGLLVPPNGTLVVEQPELHLHPALQVRIADFFLAMASIGKQIILETHSEHLVNALRVKAAEDTSNEIHKLCKIYFLSTESDKPQVHDLSVQADGSLNEWPECFFGEALSLSGRLLRAQSKLKLPKN